MNVFAHAPVVLRLGGRALGRLQSVILITVIGRDVRLASSGAPCRSSELCVIIAVVVAAPAWRRAASTQNYLTPNWWKWAPGAVGCRQQLRQMGPHMLFLFTIIGANGIIRGHGALHKTRSAPRP
jgi:hypothetical protein